MFEQFLESERIKKHILNIFLLGMFYVIIGFVVSAYFFPEQISVAMLFTTTLLLVPSVYSILKAEEKVESTNGIKNFFKDHKDILKIYIFLFIGIFFAFLALSLNSHFPIFDYQSKILESRGDIVEISAIQSYSPSLERAFNIISQNIFVVFIAFTLSLFYGAGALFLIVWNASVFAAFISNLMSKIGNSIASLYFLIHLVPEIAGFLSAAIAGGVVSRAIMRERFGSKEFSNVMKDALVLMLIAAVLIIVAAFLEVYASATLVKAAI